MVTLAFFYRSLSSVPDLHGSSANDSHHAENGGPNLGGEGSVAGSPGADTDSSAGEEGAQGGLIGHAAAAALTRVYAAHSLPGHIWSLNGKLKLIYLFSSKVFSCFFSLSLSFVGALRVSFNINFDSKIIKNNFF